MIRAGDAATEFDNLEAALDLGFGFGQRLAVLAGDQGGQFVEMFIDQGMNREHNPRSIDDRCLGPGGKSALGSRHHGRRFVGGAKRHARDLFTERGL